MRRRCGFGVPLEQMHPGDREVIEQFRRYLRRELALAADGITYVPVDSPEAVYVVDRLAAAE